MTSPVRPVAAVSAPAAGGLAEVIDTILDKGLVIDAFVRVSLIGIELLTIEVRIVVASVDTYLRFAQAMSRLGAPDEGDGWPMLTGQRQARHAAEGVVGRTAVTPARALAAPANAQG